MNILVFKRVKIDNCLNMLVDLFVFLVGLSTDVASKFPQGLLELLNCQVYLPFFSSSFSDMLALCRIDEADISAHPSTHPPKK